MCGVCRARVSAADPDGFWLLEGVPFHTRCARWDERPFPYRWAVDLGRRTLSRLRREEDPRADRVARAVAWLIDAERAWPPRDAVLTLRTASRAAALLQSCKA